MTARSRVWSLAPTLAIALTSLTMVSADTAVAAPVRTTVTQPHTVRIGDDAGFASSEERPLTIPDGQPADAYPSTAFFGVDVPIADINVLLTNVVTDNPDDLDVLLVGPQGQQVILMSDAGGTVGLDGDTIAFDDDAADPVPDDSDAGGPAWLPADYEPGDGYPAPAASNGNTDLSVFDGTSAAGIWSLYVVDDTADGNGASFSGFSIELVLNTSPYPSQMQVAGLGTLTDVDVSFERLYSSYPTDADIMLVGPRGQQVTLMSDAGGEDVVYGAHLRFDDEAARPFPSWGIAAGTYRPTDNEDPAVDDFSPGPASVGNTSLAIFDGTDPNGTWSLYAVDDDGFAYSRIEGWSLHLAWNDAAAPTGSVTVAGAAAATRTRRVSLALSATDPAPASGPTQMRFSNDGTTWSPYRPYAATTTWDLAAGEGEKTVFAQFADAAGNVSTSAQDKILLDTTGPRARSVTPTEGANNVPAQRSVKVSATEALDPKTVTRRTVVLTRNGNRVAARLVYQAAKHKIVLKPKTPLKPGSYVLKVKSKVRDLVGNRWDAKGKPGLQPTISRFEV